MFLANMAAVFDFSSGENCAIAYCLVDVVHIAFYVNDGVSPSGKAAVFGTAMRGFESFHPKLLRAAFDETRRSHVICRFLPPGPG